MKRLLTILAAVGTLTLALPAFAAAPYFVAGAFNGWNSAGNALTETFAGSGIWQANVPVTPSGRYEFKITDGTWGWTVPGANSWLVADGSGSVSISYDANSGGIGVGASGNPTTWTAVGDWQGWANANGATAMSSIGGGVYELSYAIATPGSYQYKAVDTGTWDAIGTDSRSINAANMGFVTTDANQTVDFFVNPLNGSISLTVVAVPEPSTLALLGAGLASLFCLRRRQ